MFWIAFLSLELGRIMSRQVQNKIKKIMKTERLNCKEKENLNFFIIHGNFFHFTVLSLEICNISKVSLSFRDRWGKRKTLSLKSRAFDVVRVTFEASTRIVPPNRNFPSILRDVKNEMVKEAFLRNKRARCIIIFYNNFVTFSLRSSPSPTNVPDGGWKWKRKIVM